MTVELAQQVPPTQDAHRPRKIAIIGKAPSSALLAPYGDPDWEIWILNTLGSAKEVPRWDRQFELHDLCLAKNPGFGNYYDYLKEESGKRPVYLRDDPPAEFKGGIRYPYAAVQETFAGFAGRDYLTNTVSLMAALAVYEHLIGKMHHEPDGAPRRPVAELGMWGVDMAQHNAAYTFANAGFFSSEYARQRPSVEYWIGVAEGKGIHFTVPPQSDILKTACIYGFHTNEVFKKLQARDQELAARITQAQQREQQAHDEAIYLSGAREGAKYHAQMQTGF
jgi:hypothetical protein